MEPIRAAARLPDRGRGRTVTEYGRLPDSTPWPVPVTLDMLADALPTVADQLVLREH